MLSELRRHCKEVLNIADKPYHYYSLASLAGKFGNLHRLPKSLKILLENLLRFADTSHVQENDIYAMVNWLANAKSDREIAYHPFRVLMQDFTGVPAIVDLAAMREAVKNLGADPIKINPLSNVDLIIDHSVTVDDFGNKDAFEHNVNLEIQRNKERYTFLRWGQQSFNRFRVVPPGTGICHQVNLEYLGQVVCSEEIENKTWLFPDTLVGTDSHTTMINGLGILGWGVGGIEAEAAMLGQPISMLIPEVVGFQLEGQLKPGITATDVVLTVAQILRRHGVVGKFVEFYGDGLQNLSVADRATIANMSPEFGATCTFFPVDGVTLDYMRLTGRSEQQIQLVEEYCKAQGLWRIKGETPIFSHYIKLDLATIEMSLAGPKRPQDRAALSSVGKVFDDTYALEAVQPLPQYSQQVNQTESTLEHGAVVIAAITSCTNTSNPDVMLAAALLAKNARKKNLTVKPWVKTSLAPGSKVVTDYLKASHLMKELEALGFYLVGYGCTTCIGNSGPLDEEIEQQVQQNQLMVAAVLSGNRNFEGRIHPLVKTNWLASPPLVVAYAIAGNIRLDLSRDPLGYDKNNKPVYLKDIWPTDDEIAHVATQINSYMFHKEYAGVFQGDKFWQSLQVTSSDTYAWQSDSTYIRLPPFFEGMKRHPDPVKEIIKARILAILGDSVTTDHISPAGSIKIDSPAGVYLRQHGIEPIEFNSYGSRRGNHEVMMRGTFANIRIRNEMLQNVEGGMTCHLPTNKQMAIYDAAMLYQQENTPLIVIAGKEYGSGSSRDWAAKGTRLLGVRAVIAESFERIHRSNLIGMGVLPLEFIEGMTRKSLRLTGTESLTITGLDKLKPNAELPVEITGSDGKTDTITLRCRIDTKNELIYYQNDGILHYVVRNMLKP